VQGRKSKLRASAVLKTLAMLKIEFLAFFLLLVGCTGLWNACHFAKTSFS